MTDTPTPPDGWYPDPAGGGGLRRWDGASWTDEVRAPDGSTPPAREEEAVASEPAAVESDAEVPGAEPAAAESAGEISGAERPAEVPGAEGAAEVPAAAPVEEVPVAEPAATEPAATEPAATEPATAEPAAAERAAEAPVPESPAASVPPVALAASVPPVPPVAPAASVPPVALAASVPPVPPVAPVAPAPPVTAPASPSGSYPGGAPISPSGPAGYGGAPAYPGSAAPTHDAAPRTDIRTDTVWIWLLALLPLVGVFALFLFDWSTFIQESFYAQVYGGGSSATEAVVSGVLTLASVVYYAVTVVFAYLDWRRLRARGIDNPFHWAWSFFVVLISSALVYVIGRTVIVRRRARGGLGPMWVAIAVNVVSLIALIVWGILLFLQLIPLIQELQYYGY